MATHSCSTVRSDSSFFLTDTRQERTDGSSRNCDSRWKRRASLLLLVTFVLTPLYHIYRLAACG